MLQDHRRWRTLSGALLVSPVADDDTHLPALPLPCIAAGPLPGRAPHSGRLCGFGPVAGLDAAQPVAAVCIGGVLPDALASVQVLSQGRIVYRLDSVSDARGLPLPAGALLLAMAQMQGCEAMVIDVSGLGLAAASAEVWLALSGDAGDDLPQVSLVLAATGAQSAS